MNALAERSSLDPARKADILNTPYFSSSLFTFLPLDAYLVPSFTFCWSGLERSLPPFHAATYVSHSSFLAFIVITTNPPLTSNWPNHSLFNMTRYFYDCRVRSDNVVEIRRQNGIEQLEISFKRTVRIPDNNDEFELPPDMGNFPLYKIEKYAQSLPEIVTAKRGVLMPMYREYNVLRNSGHEEC